MVMAVLSLSPDSARQPQPTLSRRETAAVHLTRDVPIAGPLMTAGEIRRHLRAHRFESAADIAVCDSSKRLLGLTRIEDVLAAPENASAERLMDKDPPVVHPGEDQEVAAWKAVRHGEGSLAVVDSNGAFVGLIPPPALIGIFLHEHEEDMARLGGYLRGTSAARTASEEPIPRRFWHKLPWLVLGLVGALIAADIVGAFEGRLENNVMLAFFLPGIVYLADAVGTQTETVVVRGLSVGVGVRRFAVREIVTGVLVGAALAAAFLPIALLRWGDTDLALAVSLSLLAACSVATIVAMALPALLQALGRDPAFGSGPLATVIQDLLSIVIYLSISTALVS
jgi:magnesium transporter